jgi:hypothetical protein
MKTELPPDSPDHDRMASDLENIASELQRQHRDLEERQPLWDPERDAGRRRGDGQTGKPKGS